ncbi:MAG: outer membrane beta-barrel protein [Chitinophagales bacterium]
MKDELNQYDLMEEQLRRNLLKYEASFNPDDWALMEEKLDKAGSSYFTFIHHPYFRLAAAALFLLTSLYGIEAWIKPYFSPSTDSGIYTSAPSIEDIEGNVKELDIVNGLTKTEGHFSVNEELERTTNQFIEESRQATKPSEPTNLLVNNRGQNNVFHNSGRAYIDEEREQDLFVYDNNSVWTQANSYDNTSNQGNNYVVARASNTQRQVLNLPTALPFNTLPFVVDITTRGKRKIPGKRTVTTKITRSLVKVPENNKGRISVGLYGSADVNFLDLSNSGQGGNSAGIEVKIKPKKGGKFAFVTGVGYSYKKFQTSNVPNNPLMSFVDATNFVSDEIKTATNTFVSEMEVIEIPLLVQYNLGKESKKVQPYVEAGVTTYVPINQYYTYESKSTWDQQYSAAATPAHGNESAAGYVSEASVGLEIRGEHRNISNKPYLGIVNTHAGVNVQLSNRLNMHIEGQVKTSIVKHKIDRSITERELNIGLTEDTDFNNRRGLHTLGLQLGVSCTL